MSTIQQLENSIRQLSSDEMAAFRAWFAEFDAEGWEAAKQRFPVGRVVRGTVTAHHPFGIFVDLSDPVTLGLVQITEFLNGGRMTPEQYPAIGQAVTAVVLGHTDEGRKQVGLCMRPSQLERQPQLDVAPTRAAVRLFPESSPLSGPGS